MKRKLHLLGLIPVLLFSTGCEGKKMKNSVNVIIISGQSNAVGCKASAFLESTMPDKYPEYLAGYEDVKIAYNNWTVDWTVTKPPRPVELQNASPKGRFVPVKLGQGNTTSNFGPEIGIAEELHERWGDKLYIIKVACGASNINDDWAQSDYEMFKTLVSFVGKRFAELEEEGLKPYLRAFCWMQGEGDSYPLYWPYYLDNLVFFKRNLDRELLKYTEDNNLPFIDAGIGRGTHSDGTDEWVYYNEVNQCKKDFAAQSETNIYFDTIENGLHSNQEPADDVHYDSESQIKLGHLFAQNFEKFLK